MSKIRITFLGTSASAPTKERGLPAVLLEYNGEAILFDAGEGTQRQFMKFGRSFMRVHHILISHYHGDHVYGLPGLISTMALYGRSEPLHIWAPMRHVPYIEQLVTAIPAGADFDIFFHGVEEGLLFRGRGYSVYAYPLEHTSECMAYVFVEAPKVKADKQKVRKLGIEGPLVRELKAGNVVMFKGRAIRPEDVVYTVPGRKIVYSVDTRPVYHELARGADVLIHDSTYLSEDGDLAREKKHSTAREAAELAKELGAKMLILTHFSARVKDVSAAEEDAREVFAKSIAAVDGYVLEI